MENSTTFNVFYWNLSILPNVYLCNQISLIEYEKVEYKSLRISKTQMWALLISTNVSREYNFLSRFRCAWEIYNCYMATCRMVCLLVCLLVCLQNKISWVGAWVCPKFSRLLIGPIQMCVGGLSQVFNASDWPNSNLKDYKKNGSCYLHKVALSVFIIILALR